MLSVPQGQAARRTNAIRKRHGPKSRIDISAHETQELPKAHIMTQMHPHTQVYKAAHGKAVHLKAASGNRGVRESHKETKQIRRMEAKTTENGVAAMATFYQRFDPAAYLQYNYTPPRADFERKDSIVPWKLACLHRAFNEGDVSGEVLVDIGSGPTLYQVLSGCEVFNKVLLTDFLEVNRQELRHWLQDEEGCNLDWTPYLQHVCKLEGRRPSEWTQKAAKLRQVIMDILPIDVHRPQPLAHDALPSAGADCLVSCFCLESVSPNLAAFTRALGHIGRLLRPGGHLMLIGALGESYYFGGPGVKIPVVPLNEAQVCESLKESGYTLIRLEVYTLPQDMRVGVDDVTGVFFAKARKDLLV